MQDIPIYKDFKVIKPILKGFSRDKKYYIETKGGEKLLLRISDISEVSKKKSEYEKLKTLSNLNIISPKTIDCGICDNGNSFYNLITWIDGVGLEEKLTTFSAYEQYKLGLKAGIILRKIHTLPAPSDIDPWHIEYNKKTDYRIAKAEECGFKSNHNKAVIDYLIANKHLIINRPRCFLHGDFHAANLVLTPSNELGIIDCHDIEYGDPYKEFASVIWDAPTSPHFARGQIDGYFNKDIPDDFFPLIAYYLASGALATLFWATQFDTQKQLYLDNIDLVMQWYDNLKTSVPNWYKQ